MKVLELHKKSLAALLLALMAMVMLTGCSTTEEETAPPPEDSRCMEGDSNYPDCLDANI